MPGRSEPGAMAEPGLYTVTLSVDGRDYVRTLDVRWTLTAPSN